MPARNELSPLGTGFDRSYRALHGLPDVTSVKAATIQQVHPVTELVETYTVQTLRHRELGDTIFITCLSAGSKAQRMALPPSVAECIARQRDALTTKTRRRAAKAEAARRKAQGIQPFQRREGEAG